MQAARPEWQRHSHHGGHDNVTWGIPDAGRSLRPFDSINRLRRTAAITRVVRKIEAVRAPARLGLYGSRRGVPPPRATPRARRGGRERKARRAAANRATRPPAPG